MIRLVKFFIYLILFVLLIFSYLTIVGLETNKFNGLIEKRIKNIDKSIVLKLNNVKIKFDPKKFQFKINTNNPDLIINKNKILLKNISSNIPLNLLILKKNFIKNINIESDINQINIFTKILRKYENNFQTIILDKLIEEGVCYLKLNINFDENNKILNDYELSGYIKNLKINLLNEEKIKGNINFKIINNQIVLNNIDIFYSGLNIKSKKININHTKFKLFEINGDMYNSNSSIKLNKKIFKRFAFNNLIDNEELKFSSNSKFSFNLNNKFDISKIELESDLDINNLKIKKNLNVSDLFDVHDSIYLLDNSFKLKYQKDKIQIFEGVSILSINNKKDKLKYNFKNIDDEIFFNLISDIKNNKINLKFIDYFKKENEISKLSINGKLTNKNFLIIENLKFIHKQNKFYFKDIYFNDKDKVKSIRKADIKFLNKSNILNSFVLSYKNDNYFFEGDLLDISKFLNSTKKNKYKIFDEKEKKVNFKIKKVYLNKNDYTSNLLADLNFKNNQVTKLSLNSLFLNGKKLVLTINTNDAREKITNLYTTYPKPLIKRYKFIKGFEEGILDFQSIEKNGISNSILVIDNFKVKEVPALAKILTLASLQGIADLLTGEGIRFTDFDMKFSTKNNLTEIEEIYAIGPAISLMMNGYVEKDKMTSLRGTLVPATTINRTISSIPLLGDILVGKKIGEGVFGVSFKIKGSPNNLKTTVNPIKTLTPRFITRTLEKLKN